MKASEVEHFTYKFQHSLNLFTPQSHERNEIFKGNPVRLQITHTFHKIYVCYLHQKTAQ